MRTRRFHIALAVDDLATTIVDYSERLGMPPVTVVQGKYALWRTPEINLSVNADTPAGPRLRHVGFEEVGPVPRGSATGGSEPERAPLAPRETDLNGVMWESFTTAQQDREIVRTYGNPSPRA
jgi:catechol 2,3-dioxygenase-like lactoylglutathione lyase family enzyme